MVDFGILVYPSIRAKIYMEKLIDAECYPSYTILMNNKDKLFDQILEFCMKNKLLHEIVDTSDINDLKIREILEKRKEEYFIFTGGGILNKDIVGMKKFIHVHPGILPDYKGSTCIYYSLLNGNFCGATAFIMDTKIDSGQVISEKVFDNPSTRDIDNYYDQFIRASLLTDVIKNQKFLKSKPQKGKGKTYYVVHPVLKHIVLLSIKPE